MLEYFEENSIDHSKLIVIGCDDGTSVNTAKNNGIIRKYETKLKRPLQRHICLLHFNELPLRHLIHALDGSSRSEILTRELGSIMSNVLELLVVEFKIIKFQYQ